MSHPIALNPASESAKTLGQQLTAVTSMTAESEKMSVSDAVNMIHATLATRSRFGKAISAGRRGGPHHPSRRDRQQMGSRLRSK